MTACILSVGTATPPLSISQSRAAHVTAEILNQPNNTKKFWSRVYHRSRIIKRHSVLLREDSREALLELPVGEPVPLSERMQIFEREAPKLCLSACMQAFVDCVISPSEVTHLITVTCTGFFAPGIEKRLYSDLKLQPSVKRYQLGFQGCHAGINALQLAKALVAEQPEANVLIVCCELCSIHFAYTDKEDLLLSNMLFGDGAAALLISSSKSAPRLRESFSYRLSQSEECLSWKIRDFGFEMTLSQSLPSHLERELYPLLTDQLTRQGLELSDVEHYVIHPGGPKILEVCQKALSLSPQDLVATWDVFARYGNMSSPTVFFILQDFIKRESCGLTLLLGFGPGLTVEGQLVQL